MKNCGLYFIGRLLLAIDDICKAVSNSSISEGVMAASWKILFTGYCLVALVDSGLLPDRTSLAYYVDYACVSSYVGSLTAEQLSFD